jgi:hypothetical protein
LPWKRSKQHFKRRTHSKKSLRWIFYSVQVFPPYTYHTQTGLRQCSFAMKNVKAAFQKAHTQPTKILTPLPNFFTPCLSQPLRSTLPNKLCSKLLLPLRQRSHRRTDFVCASPSSRSDARATGVLSDCYRLPKAAG